MKRILAATVLLALSAFAQAQESYNLADHPDKFCVVAGTISVGIMQRTNEGRPIEVMYQEVYDADQPQLSAYLNESVSLARQFRMHSSGPVDVKKFARWNFLRCVEAMKPRAHEVWEMQNGKSVRIQ